MSVLPLSILRYLLIAGCLIAAYYSTILGIAAAAYRENTQHAVRLAARLVPDNANYLRRLAGWDVSRRVELLTRAVALNPFEAQGWLQLGFDAEFRRHDQSGAERCYLQAARVDRMYLPKGTLANFYFRRENEPAFLEWAQKALEITPFPADPIFTQMWLLDPNPVKLGSSIPNRPGILLQYSSFLMNVRQFTAVPPVIKRITDAAGKGNPEWYGLTTVLGPTMDNLLGAGYPEAALQIWGFLKSAGWIPLAAPSGERPITNGRFRVPIWNHGFDWSVVGNNGIFFNQYPKAGETRYDFSGDEPENCLLLQQWMPVLANQKYRLKWNVSSIGLSKPAGIAWRIHVRQATLNSPDLVSTAPAVWEFQTPDFSKSALLTLEYARPIGEIRANGALVLQSVSIKPE